MKEHFVSNFLGLDPEFSSPETAKAAVILAPLENTTSFQHGTADGPRAFLEASGEVELYDVESGLNFSKVGVSTFPIPDLKGLRSQEDALDVIQKDVEKALERKQWPITVGGEHSMTLAPIRALKKHYANFSVLQIDAHADLSYEGSPYSHASIMARVVELGIPHVGVGIRNYCEEEAALIKEKKIPIYHAYQIRKEGLHPKKISSHLTNDVYITVDIDGFDPSQFPGTGTPEPGGLLWWDVIDLFRYTFKHHNVIGMDINEIMPLAGDARTEFAAAKLVYQMLGMKFFTRDTCG